MNGTVYFAYGANIDSDHMARTCPASRSLGSAVLAHSRLVINEDGWATVIACADSQVHGALWLLSPTCEASLDSQEDVDGGLYHKQRTLVSDREGNILDAMIYVASRTTPGRPNPGYLERILCCCEAWGFPEHYMESLSCMLGKRV